MLEFSSFESFYNFKLEFTLAQGTEQLVVGLTGLREPGLRERKPSTN